ncbi:MAG: competence/damage-inducible protein A, partial [Pseudomonadota bacterium]
PIIFREMLSGLRSSLQGGPPTLSWSLRAPVPEGDLAADLCRLAAAHPAVAIGCYPFYRGGLGSTLALRATDRAALSAAADGARAILVARSAEIVETPPETEA